MRNPRTIYYWFQTLATFGTMTTATIYTIFLFSIGLTVAEVAAVNVGFWAIIILGEIPTGMLADGRSRVWSIRVGAVLKLLGVLVYFAAHDFWSAMIAELVVGLAEAFLSGVLQAWITDALARRGESEDRRHVFATAAALRGGAALVAGILGAVIATLVGVRIVWLLDAIFLTGALVIALWYMNGDGEPLERVGERAALNQALQVLVRERALWWATAAAVIIGISVPIGHYWSPFFSERITGKAVFDGAIISPWLGAIWAMIFIPVTAAGFIVRRFSIRLGREGAWAAWSLVASGIGVALVGALPGLLMPCVFMVIHEIGRGVFDPLLESFTQHRIGSSYRATYGSVQSLIGRVGYAGTLAVVWLGTRGAPNTMATMITVLMVCGSVQAGLAGFLWLTRPGEE